jgi:hypothetical protein
MHGRGFLPQKIYRWGDETYPEPPNGSSALGVERLIPLLSMSSAFCGLRLFHGCFCRLLFDEVRCLGTLDMT